MTQETSSAPAQPGADPFDIGRLVRDLQPVRRIKAREGVVLALLVAASCMAAIAAGLGIRGDLANGVPHWMFIVRSATLLTLGIGAAIAAITAASPRVGAVRTRWWRWALGFALLYPAGALLTVLISIDTAGQAVRALDPRYGLQCLRMSGLCALVVGTAMVAWLRRGAPVQAGRAGWLVGLASGSLGAAAYSIACSENAVLYIGTWYTLAIATSAVAGRLVVPRMLRW